MTDFKKIRKEPNYSRIRGFDLAMIHKASLKWLSESLSNSESTKNVDITHHVPSIKSISENYANDMVTSAYVSNLDSFIRDYAPDFWFHGHLHNSSDYFINNCRVLCNPRGYTGEFNTGFEPELLIEVN
jgi:Icc-related predicted phosphoesterase